MTSVRCRRGSLSLDFHNPSFLPKSHAPSSSTLHESPRDTLTAHLDRQADPPSAGRAGALMLSPREPSGLSRVVCEHIPMLLILSE